jgi:hypothetical protein
MWMDGASAFLGSSSSSRPSPAKMLSGRFCRVYDWYMPSKPSKPMHEKAVSKSATKASLAKKITLPSGKVVTVGYAVDVAKRAGVLTKTGKPARFYIPK